MAAGRCLEWMPRAALILVTVGLGGCFGEPPSVAGEDEPLGSTSSPPATEAPGSSGGVPDPGTTSGNTPSSGGPEGSSSDEDGSSGGAGDETGSDGGTVTCPPGELGCACDDGACDEGTCSTVTSTCISVEDDMVFVPAGDFVRGCTDETCDPDESPSSVVFVSDFEIDRTEVTVAAYMACVADGICIAPGMGYCTAAQGIEDLPVNCVTHTKAAAYCAAMGKRLPTEAEWEKAARGTDGRLYPWGDDPPSCELARFGDPDCSFGLPAPVGSYPDGASPYGALDMAGNLDELVADWYAADYYAQAPDADPSGPAVGTERVRRGGAFLFPSPTLRASGRSSLAPDTGAEAAGFRCAR